MASASSVSDEDARASAPARLTRRAAAVSLAAAAAAALAGVPARPALAAPSIEGGNFGDALLERRRVEEGAARANLDGIMADIREEEAKLKALRFEREAESARAINAVREAEEQKARQQVVDGKTLCITPFGVDVVGISETVALVGAIGAGLTSNARKAEIAELNEKLRAVNQTLRAQIRNVPAPDAGTSSTRTAGSPSIGDRWTAWTSTKKPRGRRTPRRWRRARTAPSRSSPKNPNPWRR